MKWIEIRNGVIRRGLEGLQPSSNFVMSLTYSLADFLRAGWTERDFAWYKRAVPSMGEAAALTALCDGHTTLLMIGGKR
jgi:hypothetical protein